MPIVEVNGQELEFPDTMTPDQIKSVLQKKFPKQAQPEQPAPQQPIENVQEIPAQFEKEGLGGKALRVANGMADPVLGVAQMIPRGIGSVAGMMGFDGVEKIADKLAGDQDYLVNQKEDWINQYKQEHGIEGVDWLRIAGNVASPMNYIPAKYAAGLPKAATLGGKVLNGMRAGAMSAMMSPVEMQEDDSFAGKKGKQVAVGAAIGGALPVAGEGVARIVSPKVSDNVKTLMDEGIRPTPGQIMGGWAKSTEDKLTSVPIIGDAITAARKRGYDDFNKAVANRALEPLGKSLPDGIKPGHDLVNHVEDTLGDAYKSLLPKLTGQVDDQFTARMEELTDMVGELPEGMQKQFSKILENNLYNKISGNGHLTGESIKAAESAIGEKVRSYLTSQDPDQRALGSALSQAQANLREWLVRQNPDHASALKAINKGYANFTRLRDAAGMLGAKEGVFTPSQLANRVRAMGGKSGYARGGNLMQDLSDAAKDVLPSQYPDSGSIGRFLMGLGTLGGAASVHPAAVGALLGGSSIYSRPGVALMESALTGRQGPAWQATAEGIRKITDPSELSRLLIGGARSPLLPTSP